MANALPFVHLKEKQDRFVWRGLNSVDLEIHLSQKKHKQTHKVSEQMDDAIGKKESGHLQRFFCSVLGGGFKYISCSSLFGEDFQFD